VDLKEVREEKARLEGEMKELEEQMRQAPYPEYIFHGEVAISLKYKNLVLQKVVESQRMRILDQREVGDAASGQVH
jgi:hypothetical protein